jgi:hypothetical protein
LYCFLVREGKCIFLPLKGGELKRGLVEEFERHLLEGRELKRGLVDEVEHHLLEVVELIGHFDSALTVMPSESRCFPSGRVEVPLYGMP